MVGKLYLFVKGTLKGNFINFLAELVKLYLFLFLSFFSDPVRLYYFYIAESYLRAYVDSMPDRYKGEHIAKHDIVRKKDGSVEGNTTPGYTPAQMKNLGGVTRRYFLMDDKCTERIEQQLVEMQFRGSSCLGNGDCRPNAVLQQIYHPENYKAIDLRRQVAWHLARYPHIFAPLAPLDYDKGERYESYIWNTFFGTMWADLCFFTAVAHMWNLRITFVGPYFTEPLRCHHTSHHPDVVIVCNGGFEGVHEEANTHFSATGMNCKNYIIRHCIIVKNCIIRNSIIVKNIYNCIIV